MAPRHQLTHEHVRDDDPVVSEEEYIEQGACRGHPFLVLQIKTLVKKVDTVVENQQRIMSVLIGDMVKDETGLIPWRRSVDKKIKEVYRIAAVVGIGLVTFAGTWLWNLLTHQATLTAVGK